MQHQQRLQAWRSIPVLPPSLQWCILLLTHYSLEMPEAPSHPPAAWALFIFIKHEHWWVWTRLDLFPSTSLRKDAPKKSTGWLTRFISKVRLCWSIPQGHRSPEELPLLPEPWRCQPGKDCLGSRRTQWQILPINNKKSGSSSSLEYTSWQLVHVEVSSSDLYFNKIVSLEKRLPRSSELVGGENLSVGGYLNRTMKHNNLYSGTMERPVPLFGLPLFLWFF